MSLPKNLPNFIDVGELKISRTAIVKGKPRYLIYLPVRRNYLWDEIHRRGLKVRVYLEIVGQPENKAE